MSTLSDGTLRKRIEAGSIGLEPYEPTNIQPASIDVRLGNSFRVFEGLAALPIDLRRSGSFFGVTRGVWRKDDEPFTLQPGTFCLGSTLEHVCVPPDLVCEVRGKSSLGRVGLQIHATAGYIDPGFRGPVTLELSNIGPREIVLWPRVKIAQLSFDRLDRACERPYGSAGLGSKYQDQEGATEGRYDA